jgi:glucokinase
LTRAVLVNGVPASGKTTVGQALGAHLHAPVLGLDTVKEVLFEELGHHDADRDWGRQLGRASLESIWALLADFPADSTVVVEAWFRSAPHDAVIRGLDRGGVDQWVEIWCHAPPDVLAARYGARSRHAGHPSAADYVGELRELALTATPMALAEYLKVDTTDIALVDTDAIARWVTERLH